MGAITRAAANNITTGGVILPAGINDASVASISALAQVSAGDGITLISSQTASSSASLSFTTGIDSTYRTYLFKFINIHPSVDGASFMVNFSTDGGSNYNVTKTSTHFLAGDREDNTANYLFYSTSYDLAQSTANQIIFETGDAENDSSLSGTFSLFSPSSNIYVKHFISEIQGVSNGIPNYSWHPFVAGYGNTTSAINAVQFTMSSGNIDAGTIYMYGVA